MSRYASGGERRQRRQKTPEDERQAKSRRRRRPTSRPEPTKATRNREARAVDGRGRLYRLMSNDMRVL
jgi:hypothetical protein